MTEDIFYAITDQRILKIGGNIVEKFNLIDDHFANNYYNSRFVSIPRDYKSKNTTNGEKYSIIRWNWNLIDDVTRTGKIEL